MTHFFQTLGAATKLPAGFEAELEHERLRVQVVSQGVLQLSISRAGKFDPQPSSAVCAKIAPQKVQSFELEQDGTSIVLRTEELILTATRKPFAIRIERLDGTLVLQTSADSETGESLAYGELNNRFALHRNHALEDAFYGLGEKTGAFNRMGRDFTLWNTDVMNGGATAEFTKDRAPTDPRSDNMSTEFDPYFPVVFGREVAEGKKELGGKSSLKKMSNVTKL